jgi:hypothetical protein
MAYSPNSASEPISILKIQPLEVNGFFPAQIMILLLDSESRLVLI